MLDSALLAHLEPDQFYHQWMQTYFPTRPDNRKIHEYRPISIQPGSIGTADGSSLVRIGETTVVTGVKAEISEAPLNAHAAGFIIPNVHFAAGCSPKVRPGPPSEQVQELSAKIHDCLTKINFVDTTQLVPMEGIVWTLYVDAVVLNDDGNIWDALWLSIISALRDVLLPKLALDEDAGVVSIVEEAVTPLTFQMTPIPFTMVEYKEHLLLDPTAKEIDILASENNLLFDMSNPSKILYHSVKPGRHLCKTETILPLINAHNTLISQHLMQ